MSVERLNFTRSSKDNTYLDIPDSEIVSELNARELQLIFLYKYRHKPVHKII